MHHAVAITCNSVNYHNTIKMKELKYNKKTEFA